MSSPVADDPKAGLDAVRPYLERLWPSPAIWAVIVLLAGFCALVAMPFGGTAGALTGLASLIVMIALLIVWTPTVGVTGGELVAGRAHVPVTLIGTLIVLDPEGFRRQHGRDLDARAFLCVRGWIATGLRVDLVDPDDPTPYWLISSRRPERLRDAVLAVRTTG